MTNGNDAAFAAEDSQRSGTQFQSGLTKREYFAAMAMQGLLSNAESLREIRKQSGDNWELYSKLCVSFCVMQADALIAVLNQSPQKQEP